jgi:hypothetical protein
MPLTLESPIISTVLEVTGITIDPQTTEYSVSYAVKDAAGKSLKNGEVRGRVIEESGVIGNTHGVDFNALYSSLKTWAYGDVIEKTEFNGTLS